MATTPEEEFEGRTHVGDDARRIVESMRVSVTGSRDIRLRTTVLLVLIAAALTFVPDPYSAFGMGALIVLAYWVGWHKI